jgi:hypothetical protein
MTVNKYSVGFYGLVYISSDQDSGFIQGWPTYSKGYVSA